MIIVRTVAKNSSNRLKFFWLKVICCLCLSNELEREIKQTTGGTSWGPAKTMAGPCPTQDPLEAPLWGYHCSVQNRRQKGFNRGALRFFGGTLGLCGGLDTLKLTKSQLIYIVIHVSIWGGLGALFGGAKSPKTPPWRRDWLCDVRYSTMEKLSWEFLVYCYIT